MATPTAPVPRLALPNPHFRKPSLSSGLAQADSVRNSSIDPVPEIPQEHQHKRSSSSDLQIGQAVSSYSPIDSKPVTLPPPPPRPSTAARKYAPSSLAKENVTTPSQSRAKSNDSGYHSGGDSALTRSPETGKSPVVPMRSMFPVYNPQVTLQQQQYYPQRPVAARTNSASSRFARPEYPPSAGGWTPIDRQLGPPSAPPSVANFHLDSLSPHVSNQKDLNDLWEATHGMEPNPRIKSYDLELARTEEANFTLGADPSTPFYTLITYDTNEIAISKTCPRKQTVGCEVSINTIEPPTRRAPPNDGLITFIFPKMAAMLAINQSTELAKQHGLAPTHRDEVQASAVKRAADQEACKLRWNANAQNYELEHPALGRRMREPAFAKSPLSAISPPMSGARPVLDIHVTKPMNKTLPVITVANPRASDLESASEPPVPGIRMSTIPQSEHNNDLVSLDFNSRIMHINANQILEHVPSLFAIDSIISAIMTVAIADEKTNPILAGMELWQPKPKRPTSPYAGSIAGKSTAGSVFYATLAEREEAEEESRELAALHERDIKNKERRKQHKRWFGKSKGKEPKTRTKKVTVKEFDLEKLTHYQNGERKGQELPAPVRVLLSVMVGGLRFIVWLLTSIVSFLTWLLVTSTRCVTSEKF